MIDLRDSHAARTLDGTDRQAGTGFIVEDNDPDVFLVEEALRSQGIPAQLQRAYDGEEAIQLLSVIQPPQVPHIIIIDLNLPKITGIDILKHVRSLRVLDGTPVLILTSSQAHTDRALAIQLGADAYIAKPPTLGDFLSNVGSGIQALLNSAGRPPRGCLRIAGFHDRRPRIRPRTLNPAWTVTAPYIHPRHPIRAMSNQRRSLRRFGPRVTAGI